MNQKAANGGLCPQGCPNTVIAIPFQKRKIKYKADVLESFLLIHTRMSYWWKYTDVKLFLVNQE